MFVLCAAISECNNKQHSPLHVELPLEKWLEIAAAVILTGAIVSCSQKRVFVQQQTIAPITIRTCTRPSGVGRAFRAPQCSGVREIEMIPAYNLPEDLLAKLYREGRRLWVSTDNEQASDHFFNFCVTCVSLRDWTLKYLKLSGNDREVFLANWKNTPHFGLCADIANCSKHFGLDPGRKTKITGVESYQETLVATDLNFNPIAGITSQKPFFKVHLDDGSEKDLFAILVLTCKNWDECFEKYNIPKKAFLIFHMFSKKHIIPNKAIRRMVFK